MNCPKCGKNSTLFGSKRGGKNGYCALDPKLHLSRNYRQLIQRGTEPGCGGHILINQLQRKAQMNCPKCGKNSTIVYTRPLECAQGKTHFCCSLITGLGKRYTVYSQGTEKGCGKYLMEGWEKAVAVYEAFGLSYSYDVLEKFAARFHKTALDALDDNPTSPKPTDPWGAPVDTRGYPKGWNT